MKEKKGFLILIITLLVFGTILYSMSKHLELKKVEKENEALKNELSEKQFMPTNKKQSESKQTEKQVPTQETRSENKKLNTKPNEQLINDFINNMFINHNDENYDSVKSSIGKITTQTFMDKYFKNDKPQYGHIVETKISDINVFHSNAQSDKYLATFIREVGTLNENVNDKPIKELVTIEIKTKIEKENTLVDDFVLLNQKDLEK
ncbi:hypothetical protein NGC89_02480 [Staphylococcus xylosus]|uniref:hypothetical protein n=1 Tax=Staphylococcus xylosus TaxID=1288 RepID=UPI002DBFE4A7|nr:hypothetical protein [Staphylococcus xylosus]MEB7800333.1 hypothetical protein [Staphylococcus xylosus]